MAKKRKLKSSKEALDKIGPNTRYNMKRRGVKLITSMDPENAKRKYSRSDENKRKWFKNGFDLLQYMIVVKPYICKKYMIKNPLELEALLYLFPIQFFTIRDFKMLPLAPYNIYLKTMVDLDYVEVSVQGTTSSATIYTLTERAVKIVREFYRYLSGEEVLNPNSYTNPFRSKEAAKIDKLRERLMLKLAHQAEKNPDRFCAKLYT